MYLKLDMKQKIVVISLFMSFLLVAQEKCNLKKSIYNDIYAIDTNDINCMAKNSNKKNTLFFTFGIWCEPCRLHLPNAIKFAKEHDLEFYVLLVEAENDEMTKQAIDYLKKIKDDINVVVLKDEIYGVKRRKKNKKFVTEITPKEFENIDDYSKYILVNKEGKVVMVTNWKDNKGNDWRDDTEMVKKKILPLL